MSKTRGTWSSKDLAFYLEDRMQTLFRGVTSLIDAGRAACVHADRDYLRGRHCHCPEDLPSHLLHSEGVREGCDMVIDYGSNVRHPDRIQTPVKMIRSMATAIGAGDTVHVKTDNLPDFITHVLPCISGPIVLVTGDSDAGSVRRFEHLLDHEAIGHWFAQNCDVAYRHSKLTRLPIGIDNPVYTKLEKRLGFVLMMALGKTEMDWRARRNELGDQALLQRIGADMGTNRERPIRALCTFHNNQRLVKPDLRDLPDRLEACEVLRDNPVCDFMPRRLPQADCWRIHTHYAFEVCPRGYGLDCFRTWECLFLETIPIVKTSPLDPLYRDEGFPVVIVESFREITWDNLKRWQEEMQPLFTDAMRRRLTTGYWLDRIKQVSGSLQKR
ncbi:MAG: hypothetical protein FJY97_04350 [candidate division Zixibacteria bacterium]|nr:hypothetical protein [candidate division Zixibacteria bacterium]